MYNQNYIRKEVRRLKWEENIKYKTIAEELRDKFNIKLIRNITLLLIDYIIIRI